MKKSLVILCALLVSASVLSGCGDSGNSNQSSETGAVSGENSAATFTLSDGKAVYTDTENSPFEGGLKIEIENAAKTAKFTVTQTDGTETVDYYLFDYNTNTMEKYYYVSAMGSAYYYTYDLNAKELLKVEDGDHADKTESMKSSGRWDGAVETITGNVTDLETYFSAQYGVTISEACADANFGK